jgi:hypothetical protein
MAVTPNGITYPSDPNAKADLISFFRTMATDIDTKFLPKTGGTLTSAMTATNFSSSTGGATAGSYFLRSNVDNSGYIFYDDNLRVDNTAGRRLWVSGPVGGDVIIKPRATGVYNLVRMDATTITLVGAVNIVGTLSVSGQGMTKYTINATVGLAQTQSVSPYTWAALPGTATGFTFVAPKSGAVLITLGALLSVTAGQVGISYEVRTGATIGAGTIILDKRGNPIPGVGSSEPSGQSVMANGFSASTSGNVQYATLSNTYHLSGLTAGATYNIRHFYRNHNTVSQNALRISYVLQPDV